LDDPSSLECRMGQIASFLKGEQLPVEEWVDAVDSLLPDSVLGVS